MEKEVLECVLKQFWKDSSVKSVLSIESSPVVGKNQNFLSEVTRIKVKVVLGNGRLATRSFIVKDSKVMNTLIGAFAKTNNVFETEIMLYNNVLKEMENLMEEFDDTRGVLWCQLVHYVPYSRLVLEDLNTSGFSLMKQGNFWDLDHTLLLVDALGRYHAMSKVLEERGLLPQYDKREWFLLQETEMSIFWVGCANATIRGIKKYWKPYWGPIVDKIKVSIKIIHEKVQQMKKSIDSLEFKVLNHGDCHMKNIMFKHDWLNRPIDVRFLDFQGPHYSSPCCDLTSILCLGVSPAMRRASLDLILKTYHDSLIKTLDLNQFGGRRPDLAEIRDGIDRLSFLLLLVVFNTCAINCYDRIEDTFDMEKITATEGEEGFNEEILNDPSLEDIMGPDIIRFVEEFF